MHSSFYGANENLKPCAICYETNQFKVFPCGHPFCIDCIKKITHYKLEDVDYVYRCPFCMQSHSMSYETLQSLNEYKAEIFFPDVEELCDFNEEIKRTLISRKQTLQHLKMILEIIQTHDRRSNRSKAGGFGACIAGGVLVTVGGILSLTGVGAVIGAPLAIGGGVLTAAGGTAAASAYVSDVVVQYIQNNDVKKHLQNDGFRTQRITWLLERMKDDENLAKKLNVNITSVSGIATVVPRAANVTMAGISGTRFILGSAVGMGRAASILSIEMAGVVFAAAMLPIDIIQFVFSIKAVIKKEGSKAFKHFKHITEQLEKQFRFICLACNLLREVNYLSYCGTKCWAHVITLPEYAAMDNTGWTEDEIYENCLLIINEGQGLHPTSNDYNKLYKEWIILCNSEQYQDLFT